MVRAETGHDFGTVSAILPTYNSARFVTRAIDSVLRQHGPFLAELIVVDDCSSDETMSLIKTRYGADARLRLLRTPQNIGPGGARNLGLKAAAGTWVAPIDADDAWTADRLQRLSRMAAPGVEMLFDNISAFDEIEETVTGAIFSSLPREMSVTDMAAAEAPGSTYNYGYLKPLIRRSFLDRTGVGYREMRISEDLLFYLELLLHRPRTQVSPDAGYIYTTPIGHLSGRRATASASAPHDLAVADALDELRVTHANKLTSAESAAIMRRAEKLRRSAPLSRLYDSWTRGHYASFVWQCLTDPAALRALTSKLRERKRRGPKPAIDQ